MGQLHKLIASDRRLAIASDRTMPHRRVGVQDQLDVG